MPDIANYAESVQVILGEGAKYFALLLFSVLAIRFWRNVRNSTTGNRGKAVAFACLASVTACVIGCVSMRHSLGLMYSSYGLRAFRSGKVSSALGLFHSAVGFWRGPDAVGQEGVCLVLLKQAETGRQLLAEARAMRHGKNTPFEEFYSGLAYFLSDRPDQAVPLLESSSRDPDYRWGVTKLLCLIMLDKQDVRTAARLMGPFARAEIQEYDHAYIVACLRLAEGKTNEARALVDKHDDGSLPPRWKPRFEGLRAKIQN